MIRIRNTAVDYPDPQQAVQRDRKSERNKALMVMDLRYKKKNNGQQNIFLFSYAHLFFFQIYTNWGSCCLCFILKEL